MIDGEVFAGRTVYAEVFLDFLSTCVSEEGAKIPVVGVEGTVAEVLLCDGFEFDEVDVAEAITTGEEDGRGDGTLLEARHRVDINPKRGCGHPTAGT